MKPAAKRPWVVTFLHSLLVGSLVESSSYLSVSSLVGHRAVLPCSWKQRLEAPPPSHHVQWSTPHHTVFELRGDAHWAAPAFQDRLQVPQENLGSGDCSLLISDVQIGDAGRYESFMLVDDLETSRTSKTSRTSRTSKTRVFIQSVRLSVVDHKSLESRGPGEDLVLDLYTRHSARVVFQDRNGSAWAELWAREDGDGERLAKHPLAERLTLKTLGSADEGIYKVLDENGLAVSTVRLSVDERSTALRAQQLLEDRAPAGDVTKSSCSSLLVSSLLVLSLLVTSSQITHLV